MSKVAIYVCIKNDSIPIVNTIDYCREKGIEDYEVFVDNVKSSHDINYRPALENLKLKILNKDINKLIINDIANISRDTIYNANFIDFVYSNNCTMTDIHEMDYGFYDGLYKIIKQEMKNLSKNRKSKINMKKEELEK